MKSVQKLMASGLALFVGIIIGVIFTYVSLYTGGLQALELIFGNSVVGQMTDPEYVGGTAAFTSIISGVLASLILTSLFEPDPPEEHSTETLAFSKSTLFGAVCGFCLPIGPLTGHLLGYLFIAIISTVAGVVLGAIGGFAYTVYTHHRTGS